MASIDIGASVTEYLATRKNTFSHDRIKTVGASEIGACARMIGYRKSSTPTDEGYSDSSGAAARGDIMEDGWSAPLLRKAVEKIGGELLWAGQENQMSIVNQSKFVSATPDGLAINMPRDCLAKYGVKDILDFGTKNVPDDKALPVVGAHVNCIVCEFKSYDPRTNVEKLPKSQHVDQVNMQLGLIRTTEFVDDLTGEVKRYAPTYGIIVYVDASDYTKISIAVVQYDHKGFMGQLSRAGHIMKSSGWEIVKGQPKWNADGVKGVELLRPEGKIMNSGECRYCAFAKRCTGYAAFVPKVNQVPSKKVVTSIRKLAHMVQDLKDQRDAISKQLGEAEADLKEELASAKVKFLTPEVTGDLSLNWKQTEGKEITDTAAMAKWIENAAKKLKTKPPSFKRKSKPSESLSVEFVSALAK